MVTQQNLEFDSPPQAPKLPQKASRYFIAASLVMLAAVMASSPHIYPFNTDPCRPCRCSPAGELEECVFDGLELRLYHRGITRVVPGALRSENLPSVESI